MPSPPSALKTIRQSLMSGVCLPAMIAAPIALGVPLAGNAAPMDTLSTIQATTFNATTSNILITSAGGVVDGGPGSVNELDTGVWVQSGRGWTLTNQGTITISANASYLQANGIYAETAGTIINSGLISAPNAYTGIQIGSSSGNLRSVIQNTGTVIGTLTITGAYTQQSGSTLAIQTTSSTASKLAVTGTATMAGTLSITSAGGGYGDSTTYTILTATGGVSGAFSAITSSDATLTPTATFDTAHNRIQLTLSKVTPQPDPDPNPGPNPTPTPTPTPTPPATGVIDTSRPSYTNGDGAVQGSTVTFDGGTLRPASPLTVGQSVTVTSRGGTITPEGSSVTLAGAVGGSGALAASGPGTVVVSGQLANGAVNGAVTVTSGGTATLAGAVMAPVTVGDGTVTVAATGTTGAVTVGQGGAVTVNGTVSGSVSTAAGSTFGGGGSVIGPATLSGTVSPGNSPGVLTFQSAVTLTGTSVLRAEIDGPTAGTGAGRHDQIRVEGAPFTAAGTLAPVLRGISGDATNAYTATLGQSFIIVQAGGGVSGSFAALTQPAAGLEAGTRFDTLYGADTVRLVVTPANYAVRGGTPNQRAAGAAVDALRPAAGARLEGVAAPLFGGLYGLPGRSTSFRASCTPTRWPPTAPAAACSAAQWRAACRRCAAARPPPAFGWPAAATARVPWVRPARSADRAACGACRWWPTAGPARTATPPAPRSGSVASCWARTAAMKMG